MGHCVDNPKDIPGVVAQLNKTSKEKGVRLRVLREEKEGEMETIKVSTAD